MPPDWLEDFAARSNSTQEQWDAIAALLPIPDEGQRRRCLLLCFQKIQRYWWARDRDAQVVSARTIRDGLAEVAKLARQLCAAINALPHPAQLDMALAARNPDKNWEEFIKNTIEANTKLAVMAETASTHGPKDKPGPPPNDALDWLVTEIAIIWLQHVPRPFNRSKNRGGAYEFMRAIVDFADPAIGPGTLDHAMRGAVEELGSKK